MLCVISFIFVFVIVAQLEGGDITFGQAIFYGFYGLLDQCICQQEPSEPYSRVE